MNKPNAKAGKRGRRHEGAPSAQQPVIRLRVTTRGESSWTVPLERAVSASSGQDSAQESQRIELSLIRSVTQAGLRRGGSVWGR